MKMKFVRFDQDHFGYLIGGDYVITKDEADQLRAHFTEAWPGKRLIVVAADEVIDLTGVYEVLPIDDRTVSVVSA